MNPMITINKKPTIETQKLERKESIPLKKVIKRQWNKQKRTGKNYKNNRKTEIKWQ